MGGPFVDPLLAPVEPEAPPPKPEGKYEKEFGGLLGQGVSAVFGAGRMATGGLMDDLLIEGAYAAGGDSAMADMRQGLRVAKETNPYATMGGEAAGLFLPGIGTGLTGAGTAIEEAAAGRLGQGLLGRVGSMALRGGIEGAALGESRAVSEEALGDPNANGEKLAAAAMKDGLLGAGIGGGLGVLAHGASGLLGALKHSPGPRPAGLLDEVVGTPGAGKVIAREAEETEALVQSLRRSGATSEQAAIMADEVATMAKARMASAEHVNPFLAKGGASAFGSTEGGWLSSFVDDNVKAFAKARSGGNAQIEEALLKGYSGRASRIIESRNILDNQTAKLVESGSKMMRAEEVLDRLSFTERPQQFERLMKASAVDADKAADAAIRMTQMADAVVSELEAVPLMDRNALAVKQMRKILNVTYQKHAALVDATTGAAREAALRDLYMSTYEMKQEFGRISQFGKVNREAARAQIPTTIEGKAQKVYEFLRTGLEDEGVWGAAGRANRDINEAFAASHARRLDFGRKFGVSIDEVAGTAKPEVDFDKVRGILGDLRGSNVDSMRQAVKDAEAFVDGIRTRADAAEKHLAMSAADKAAITEARAAATEFEKTFAAARKEAEVVNRLKDLQLEEQGKAIGGTIGFLTDIVTRPVTTMERLGAVKVATQKLEKAIEGGLNKFFTGKGQSLVSATKPRAAAEVTKEIGLVREMLNNPRQMESRAEAMVSELREFAPQTADGAKATALRLMTFLAVNAPTPTVSRDVTGKTSERYSPSQIASYERKREAAMDPRTVLREMDIGSLNRDGIRTVKAVYPQLFAEMQMKAMEQIADREGRGQLALSRAQKKAIAALLEVPADATFEPKFIVAMQATTAPLPQAPQGPESQGPMMLSKRPMKIDPDVFATDAQQIEGQDHGN